MEENNKINSENLEQVTGGRLHPHPGNSHRGPEDVYCGGYTTNPKHEFEFILNTETPGEYYGISRCRLCGYEKKVYDNPSPLK